MGTGRLIITARDPTIQLINRLLLHLRDYEYGDEETWDCHSFMTSKTVPPDMDAPAISPPITEPPSPNEWEGVSIDIIERLMLMTDSLRGVGLFLVLDDQGVQDETLIVAERVVDWEDDAAPVLVAYNKVRLPWAEVHIFWVNLDIANIFFDEMAGNGPDENYWWTYTPDPEAESEGDIEVRTKRAANMEELSKLNLI